MTHLNAEHFKLIDAVNDATSAHERQITEAVLRGWRQGVADAGRYLSYSDADWHTGARYGHPDLDDDCPPICGGVRLDWSVDGYPAKAGA